MREAIIWRELPASITQAVETTPSTMATGNPANNRKIIKANMLTVSI
jgi:hypothetical protein